VGGNARAARLKRRGTGTKLGGKRLCTITGSGPEAQASVAERPIALPPATERERGTVHTFSKTLVEHAVVSRQFKHSVSAHSADMRDQVRKCRRLISQCRNLMTAADEILERDRQIMGGGGAP